MTPICKDGFKRFKGNYFLKSNVESDGLLTRIAGANTRVCHPSEFLREVFFFSSFPSAGRFQASTAGTINNSRSLKLPRRSRAKSAPLGLFEHPRERENADLDGPDRNRLGFSQQAEDPWNEFEFIPGATKKVADFLPVGLSGFCPAEKSTALPLQAFWNIHAQATRFGSRTRASP